jgi:hypothetical protein
LEGLSGIGFVIVLGLLGKLFEEGIRVSFSSILRRQVWLESYKFFRVLMFDIVSGGAIVPEASMQSFGHGWRDAVFNAIRKVLMLDAHEFGMFSVLVNGFASKGDMTGGRDLFSTVQAHTCGFVDFVELLLIPETP